MTPDPTKGASRTRCPDRVSREYHPALGGKAAKRKKRGEKE